MKENNSRKQMDSKMIQESLLDYNNLAEKLNESTPDIVKNLLEEQVKQAYINILNEATEDEDDYEVEEVDDTTTDPSEDIEASEEATETSELEDSEEGMDSEGEEEPTAEVTEVEVETTPEDEEDEDMSQEFADYKVGENEYDFRDAEDEELVKVYKKLKDTDGVTVVKDGNKVEIKDDEAGTEYLIDMGPDTETSDEDVIEDDNNNIDNMNESRIFEIALNEYDSKVGYTDNYQKKDVMTNDGASETSKYGRDIDKGAPKGTSKPWSKQKKSVGPFNGEKGKTVECGDPTITNNAPEMDEHNAGGRMGAMGRMTGVKTHRPNSGNVAQPEGQHNVSVAGEYKGKPSANEAVEKKLNKIIKENQTLKANLNKVTKMLQEAAVVNVNLGGIIKLISENSTTKDEKHEIINRFTNEAHTIQESKTLYESIAKELKKNPQTNVNINEEKQFVNADTKTINESKFYQDESLMSSLGLMHKIC